MFTVARYVIAKLLTVPKYVGLVEQRLCVDYDLNYLVNQKLTITMVELVN